MKNKKESTAKTTSVREEKDLAMMQGKTRRHYETFDEIESGFLEGYCCYECYITALKERIAWLIMENSKLRTENNKLRQANL